MNALPSWTAALLILPNGSARGGAVTLEPVRDNTLYESVLGNVSNGKGDHLFAGLSAMAEIRRGLLAFDVAAAVPQGSQITSVELRMNMSRSSVTVPKSIALHRARASWGEGASNALGEEGGGAFAEPCDATWLHRFHPGVSWALAGGDYDPVVSSAIPVGPVGGYVWSSTPAMVADVQAWLDQPAENHGWIVIGDEVAVGTTKRFDTRDHPDLAVRPQLTVLFDPACTGMHPSSEVVRVGAPPNPSALLPGQTTGPLIGRTWDPLIDHTSFAPAAVLDFMGVDLGPPINVPLGIGTLLCTPPPSGQIFFALPGSAFAVPVPSDCGLLGLDACAQGGSLGPALQVELANALDLVIGNT